MRTADFQIPGQSPGKADTPDVAPDRGTRLASTAPGWMIDSAKKPDIVAMSIEIIDHGGTVILTEKRQNFLPG